MYFSRLNGALHHFYVTHSLCTNCFISWENYDVPLERLGLASIKVQTFNEKNRDFFFLLLINGSHSQICSSQNMNLDKRHEKNAVSFMTSTVRHMCLSCSQGVVLRHLVWRLPVSTDAFQAEFIHLVFPRSVWSHTSHLPYLKTLHSHLLLDWYFNHRSSTQSFANTSLSLQSLFIPLSAPYSHSMYLWGTESAVGASVWASHHY